MEKLKDIHVRTVLLKSLVAQYSDVPDTRIINELGIDFGASRIDVAVVNGILHGYEIKSESDNLKRLPKQMEYYNRLFERMTLVIDLKYYEEAKQIIPDWWGIKVVVKNANGFSLVTKRKGRHKRTQDKELLLKLLWKEDLERLIDFIGYPKSFKSLRKNQLLKIFVEKVKLENVREFVYNVLKRRSIVKAGLQ
jgi:hypothetical protein